MDIIPHRLILSTHEHLAKNLHWLDTSTERHKSTNLTTRWRELAQQRQEKNIVNMHSEFVFLGGAVAGSWN